jgi:hypothetical protein
MSADELNTYVDGRFSELLNYYDKRAVSAKWGYTICSVYVLVVSVAIAPIQAMSLGAKSSDVGKIIVAILSPTVALIAGLAAHFKFHENWLSFRATWDALQRELALFKAGAGDYRSISDANARFVERVEALAANEGKDFYSRHASQPLAAGAKATSPNPNLGSR